MKYIAALMMLLASAAWGQSPPTVTVADTVILGIGSATYSGRIVITAPERSYGSVALVSDPVTVTVTAGVFSVALVPNDATYPATVYTATYYSNSGAKIRTESWYVPTSATTLTLLDVVTRRTVTPPNFAKLPLAQLSPTGATESEFVKLIGGVWSHGLPAWDSISGKPTTFTPALHAASHGAAGTDPVQLTIGQISNLQVSLDAQTAAIATKQSKVVISVLDYGADPTGVTDSTTAIQDAVTAACGNDTELQVLDLASGAYGITSPITIPACRGLRIQNGELHPLTGFTSGEPLLRTTEACTAISGFCLTDAVIDGVTLNGSIGGVQDATHQANGFECWGCLKVSVINSFIWRTKTYGIWFTGDPGDAGHDNVVSNTKIFEYPWGDSGYAAGPFTSTGLIFDTHDTWSLRNDFGYGMLGWKNNASYNRSMGDHFYTLSGTNILITENAPWTNVSDCYVDTGNVEIRNPWQTTFHSCRFLFDTANYAIPNNAAITLKPLSGGLAISGLQITGSSFHDTNDAGASLQVYVDTTAGGFNSDPAMFTDVDLRTGNSYRIVTPFTTYLPTLQGQSAAITGRITQSGNSVPMTTYGTAAPTSTPGAIGDIYVDTTNSKTYIAKGTSSSADWVVSQDGGGSGSMVYPGAGVAYSPDGLSWGTSLGVGTAANNLVQLDGSARYPSVDGSQIAKVAEASGLNFLGGWRAAVSKRHLGQSTNPTIAVIGDSLTANGYITSRLRSSLKSGLGDGGFGWWDFYSVDGAGAGMTRSSTGTWTGRSLHSSSATIGLSGYDTTSSDTATPATITLTSGEFVDNFVLYYATKVGGGSFQYQIDSGAFSADVPTVDTATGIASVTVATGAQTPHSLTVKITDAGTTGVTLLGVDVQRSNPGLRLHQLGNSGSSSTEWAAVDAALWQAQLTAIAPDAVIVALGGINDTNLGNTVSAYTAAMTTIGSRIKTAAPLADVIFVSQPLILANPTLQASMIAAMSALAKSAGYTYIDAGATLGSYADALARGLQAGDGVHPNSTGGKVIADSILPHLGAPVRGPYWDAINSRLGVGVVSGALSNVVEIEGRPQSTTVLGTNEVLLKFRSTAYPESVTGATLIGDPGDSYTAIANTRSGYGIRFYSNVSGTMTPGGVMTNAKWGFGRSNTNATNTTMSIYDGGASGITNLTIKAGSGQGTNRLLTVLGGASATTPIFGVDPGSSNNSTFFMGAGDGTSNFYVQTIAGTGTVYMGPNSASPLSIRTGGVTRLTVASNSSILTSAGTNFEDLGPATGGKWSWCPNCVAANPCAGSGTGAWAFANGSTWSCAASSSAVADSLSAAYIDWDAVTGGASILNKPTLGTMAALDNPLTTAGDIFIGGTSGAPARLAGGAANTVLAGGGAGVAPSFVAASTLAVASAAALAANPSNCSAGLLPRGVDASGASEGCAAVSLTADISGILPVANGGTNNAYFTVSGPATSAKTYTFPNASATILTTNAAVTVAQGGTGASTATAALNALLPSQTGNSGKFLTTNGTDASWGAPTGSGNMTMTTQSGAPSGACTAGTGWVLDTATQEVYACTVSGTWKRVLTTTDSGVGILSLLEGTAPGAGASAGLHNAYFDSADSLFKSHENGGSVVTYYSTANLQPTAAALAANGSNCSAGSLPRGVDASGAAEGCAAVAIGSEVSGLGTGVATLLATPSSANLAAAITGETGTDALVFATSPTLVTPNLGTPSAINLANATALPTAGLASNAVTSAKMAIVNTRRVCDMVFGDTSGSALANGQLGPQKRLCYIPAAATLQEVIVSADGGTPNIIIARNVAGTVANVVSTALATAASGGIACSKTSAVAGIDGTTCAATLQNTALAAGSYIEAVSGTAGGTAKLMTVHAVYTID